MISEKELLVNRYYMYLFFAYELFHLSCGPYINNFGDFRFISIPKDMGTFNCGAFVAGIVRVRSPLFIWWLVITNWKHYWSFLSDEGCLGQCRFPSSCNCSFCSSGRAVAAKNHYLDKVCWRGTFSANSHITFLLIVSYRHSWWI